MNYICEVESQTLLWRAKKNGKFKSDFQNYMFGLPIVTEIIWDSKKRQRDQFGWIFNFS